jgi:hypothetical protein
MNDQTQRPDPAAEGARRVAALTPLALKLCERCLLLWPGSGPKTQEQLDDFRKVLVRRYTWDKALKFADDTNNRFLNKARGLITFNGLTLATFGTLIKSGGPVAQIMNPWLFLAGMLFTLLSALALLLTHFLINFGPTSEYVGDKEEFESYIVLVAKRAKWISIAGFLSIISLAVVSYASYRWIHAAPAQPPLTISASPPSK